MHTKPSLPLAGKQAELPEQSCSKGSHSARQRMSTPSLEIEHRKPSSHMGAPSEPWQKPTQLPKPVTGSGKYRYLDEQTRAAGAICVLVS